MKLYDRIQAMSEAELRVWVGAMQDRTRSKVAQMGGTARAAKLTPAERSAIARKAGKAGGRGRKAVCMDCERSYGPHAKCRCT